MFPCFCLLPVHKISQPITLKITQMHEIHINVIGQDANEPLNNKLGFISSPGRNFS